MSRLVYHLAQPVDWARSTEQYTPPSVETEGFIHCSTEEQLPAVARELYSDQNDLILLTINPEAVDEGTLVYEDLYGHGQDFPHIYGRLPTSAVKTTGPYLTHLEEALWRDTRFDHTWMERILHPDFAEVGMSGRTYGREETIETARPSNFEPDLPHQDYRMELIDEDVALVRYISNDRIDGAARRAHRTSVWLNTNDGWRLRFHQGTPAH